MMLPSRAVVSLCIAMFMADRAGANEAYGSFTVTVDGVTVQLEMKGMGFVRMHESVHARS